MGGQERDRRKQRKTILETSSPQAQTNRPRGQVRIERELRTVKIKEDEHTREMKMYNSKIWLGFIVVLGSLGGRDCGPVSGSLKAEKLGDIMLGGLFPVHQSFKIVNTSSSPIQHVCNK